MSVPATPHLAPPRGLATEEEVEAWATFVGASFAFKKPVPPTRAHFLRHFRQDPYSHNRNFIRVVVDETRGEFLAAARLVLRPLRLGGWGAGVAEVCVAPTHRGRGLAQVVVQDVLAVASLASPVPCLSFLHCAPALVPMYAKMGYLAGMLTRWVHIHLENKQQPQQRKLTEESDERVAKEQEQQQKWQERQEQEEDGGRMCCLDLGTDDPSPFLHEMAALPRSLPDVMGRDTVYWLAWVRGEILGGERNVEVWGLREADGKLAAYSILRRQPGAPLTVMDLGIAAGRKALPILLQLAAAGVAAGGAAATTEDVTVRLPAALLDGDSFKDTVDGANVMVVQEEVDPGWMYRPLTGQEGSVGWRTFHAQYVQKGEQHLIWPIDNF